MLNIIAIVIILLLRWTAVNLGCILDEHFNYLLPVDRADPHADYNDTYVSIGDTK